MKLASFAFALTAGFLTVVSVTHADPFSGMRGTPIHSTGRYGANQFYFGLRSTWESRADNGRLTAAGTYSFKNAHQVCFEEASRFVGSGPSGCMRYVSSAKNDSALALYDSKGLVARFVVPARGMH